MNTHSFSGWQDRARNDLAVNHFLLRIGGAQRTMPMYVGFLMIPRMVILAHCEPDGDGMCISLSLVAIEPKDSGRAEPSSSCQNRPCTGRKSYRTIAACSSMGSSEQPFSFLSFTRR